MLSSPILNQPISPYLQSPSKRIFDLTIGILLLILSFPLFLIISLLVLITSGTPIIFTQKRTGKNNKPFYIFKFRTMIRGAPQQQWRYLKKNQADGPVFKIKNDPRFIGIGRRLANSGLDELPQLINVVRGDMSLVGPRPLPTSEAKKIAAKYQTRHLVRPGITSTWVVSGAHDLSFADWMKLDHQYLKSATFKTDLLTLIHTFKIISHMLLPS